MYVICFHVFLKLVPYIKPAQYRLMTPSPSIHIMLILIHPSTQSNMRGSAIFLVLLFVFASRVQCKIILSRSQCVYHILHIIMVMPD
jgi:hypothetical protein